MMFMLMKNPLVTEVGTTYNYDYHNNYYDLNNFSLSSIGFNEDDVHVNVVEGLDTHDNVE